MPASPVTQKSDEFAVTSTLLLSLALPAAVSVLLNNAFKVIDQYSVQWLGVDAQAAIGAVTFILIGLFAIYAIFSSGTAPLIARATGARDFSFRRRILGNALSGALLIGVFVLVACGLMAPWIANSVGLKGTSAQAAATYLRWLAGFGFPLVLAPLVDSVFIAMGKTRIVMWLQVLATVLNMVLNPLLIYSADLGIAGAAMATGISRGASVGIGLLLIWREIRPAIRDFRPDRTLARIIRIGLPIFWSTGLYAAVYWALLRVAISPLGPEVNAALGIGFSALEGLTWPVFWGFSLAVASLTGRCLGAGRIDQALATIRIAFPIITGSGLAAAALFWFAAEPLCDIFTQDEKVLHEAILYAKILAFSQLFVAYEALAEGVLEGAGDTLPILYWSAPLNLLRIPFGWIAAFPLGFGAAGIWWVINFTTLVKALGKWYVVLQGRWQKISI